MPKAEPKACANCYTADPVGGLRKTWRNVASSAETENVLLCEICYTTRAGIRFISGGETDQEMIVIVQCMNLLRKDLVELFKRK